MQIERTLGSLGLTLNGGSAVVEDLVVTGDCRVKS